MLKVLILFCLVSVASAQDEYDSGMVDSPQDGAQWNHEANGAHETFDAGPEEQRFPAGVDENFDAPEETSDSSESY